MIALTATGHETLGWLLLGGTVIWAVGHKRRAPRSWLAVIGILAGGLVLAYLWLIGLWWVAVLVHAGHNLDLLSIIFLLRWWDAVSLRPRSPTGRDGPSARRDHDRMGRIGVPISDPLSAAD